MKIIIDFEKRQVHFPKNVSLFDLGATLNDYFSEEIWLDFKVMIDERIDEDSDTEAGLGLPF